MVIYGPVCPLTIETRVNSWQKHAPETRTSVGVVWVIAHVGLKRKL